jgi:O-antigen/teichoic acid export membrane protein
VALVIGILAQSAARSLQLVSVGWRRWRPGLHFARADLTGYLSFGLYQIGERTIYYLSANIDYLLIGRYLGASPLGVYTIAYQLVVMPVSRLNPILTKVAFPVFSRRQDDPAALRRGFGELTELVALVTFPLLIGLGVVAPVAVPAIFGPDWQPSVVLVQIMAVMGLLMCLSNPLGAALLAKGRADVGFWLNVASTAVAIPALWFAVRWGTSGVAWTHTLIAVLFFFVELWIIDRILGMTWPIYVARLWRTTVAVVVMGVSVGLLYLIVSRVDLRPAVQLVPLVALGASVYVAAWWVIGRSYIRELGRLLVTRAPRGEAPGAAG